MTSRYAAFEAAIETIDRESVGQAMHDLMRRLFPICRSLTGDGVRQTIRILTETIPLKVTELPTGTQCLDWTVPNEWTVRDAYVKNAAGERVVDWRTNNLHLVGYSAPVSARMSLEDLRPRLHALPDQPDAIPYVTSYYKEQWGFCLTQRQLDAMGPGPYEVVVDTTLAPGTMTLAEAVLAGTSSREVLFSTYVCHPSLANNELSGPVVTAHLYRHLSRVPSRRYTYRFVFVPETIGALAYLALHGPTLLDRVDAGYVVTCVGDPGPFTLKKSRRGETLADRAALHVLERFVPSDKRIIHDFFPTGSDERQYCSPGFNLPVASLMRSMYGAYPEYHTSLDNLDFVTPAGLAGTLKMYLRVVGALECNARYVNLSPRGEPQLGKRGLYPTLGGANERQAEVNRLLWLLSFSDGSHDLLAIADRSKFDIGDLATSAERLVAHGLLAETGDVVNPSREC